MTVRVIGVGLLCAVACTTLSCVDEQSTFLVSGGGPVSEASVVPTEMCHGYFFVPVTLGDEADPSRTLWFLHDTGASTTFVDPDSLARVSGKRVAVGRRASIRSAVAGPVKFTNLKARVRQLDHLSTTLGREIDGILAFGAFGEHLLTLDYGAGEMRVARGVLPRPDGVTVFSSSGRDDRPWLDVDFGDRRRRMLIDSGAARSALVVGDLDGLKTKAPSVVIGGSTRFRHVEQRSGARLDGNATFANHDLIEPTLTTTVGTELIGGLVLRHFALTFDTANERVRIIRTAPESVIEFEPLVAHGMVLVPRGAQLVVHRVVEDGSAAAAGIVAGDVITHFQGVPVASRGCDSSVGKVVSVTFRRAGKTLEADLQVAVVVK